jgi:alkanesulfonate monooxygenase SsuD/methylene tetrahydromethanopterin reductase-like flavin-dependent oxidoreductase (luciferase family)
MRFGIWSNGLRERAIAADIYDLDLEEIVAADRLGYDEAWVSEHIGGPSNAVPNAELLIAKASGLTSRIKMGVAVRLLPLYNPLDVATGAAMLDHLLRGRYLFGFGSGIPFFKNMEQRGLTNDMRHAMVNESIELIVKCWTATEPFAWNGEHWNGTSIRTLPRPYQHPYPPISVATSQTSMLQMAGARGWTSMYGQFEGPESIGKKVRIYLDAARAAGRPEDRGKITVARHIHVADDVATAREELRAGVEPAIEFWKKFNPERFVSYMPAGGRVEDITYDSTFESGLFIAGDAETVYQKLKDHYERIGGFGTLLVVMGKDWSTPEWIVRSLERFMSEVAPRLAQLGTTVAVSS